MYPARRAATLEGARPPTDLSGYDSPLIVVIPFEQAEVKAAAGKTGPKEPEGESRPLPRPLVPDPLTRLELASIAGVPGD